WTSFRASSSTTGCSAAPEPALALSRSRALAPAGPTTPGTLPWAASTARCASLGPASLTVATIELSAGLTTSKVEPPRACTHLPWMYVRAVSDVMTPRSVPFAEAVRRLDPGGGAGDVLAFELLEVADPRHDVVALGRMAGLRPLERPPGL